MNYKNLLLINAKVKDCDVLINALNSYTFHFVYNDITTYNELLLLKKHFNSINRIAIACHNSDFIFIENKQFMDTENLDFIIAMIKKFNVKNLDFLACDTLSDTKWTNFYDLLMNYTNVIVGASNNNTGNIKFGGDWVMENTSEDIENLYFSENIKYYAYLFDLVSNFDSSVLYSSIPSYPNNSSLWSTNSSSTYLSYAKNVSTPFYTSTGNFILYKSGSVINTDFRFLFSPIYTTGNLDFVKVTFDFLSYTDFASTASFQFGALPSNQISSYSSNTKLTTRLYANSTLLGSLSSPSGTIKNITISVRVSRNASYHFYFKLFAGNSSKHMVFDNINFYNVSSTSQSIFTEYDARQMYLNSANGYLYSDSTFSTLFSGYVTYNNKLYNEGLLYTGFYSTKLYVSGVENPTGTGYMLGTKLYNGQIENPTGTYVLNETTLYNGQNIATGYVTYIGNNKLYNEGSLYTGFYSTKLYVSGVENPTGTGYMSGTKLYNGQIENPTGTYVLNETTLYNGQTVVDSSNYKFYDFNSATIGPLPIVSLTNLPSTNLTNWSTDATVNTYVTYSTSSTPSFAASGVFIKYISSVGLSHYLISPVFNSGSNSYVTVSFDFLHYSSTKNEYMQFGCITKEDSNTISSSKKISLALTKNNTNYTTAAMKKYTINFQVSPNKDYYIFIKLVYNGGNNMALDNLLIVTQDNYTTLVTSTVLGNVIDARQMYLNSANGYLYSDSTFFTLFPGYVTYDNKLYNEGLLYTGFYSTKLYVSGVENPTGTGYMLDSIIYNGQIENPTGSYIFNGTTLYYGQTVVDSSNYRYYNFNSATAGALPIVSLTNLPSTNLTNWSTDAPVSTYVTYSTSSEPSFAASGIFIKYNSFSISTGTLQYLISPVFNSGSNSYVTFSFDFLHNSFGFSDYMQFGCISKNTSDGISSSTISSALVSNITGYSTPAMKKYTINFQVSPNIDYYIFIILVSNCGFDMALDNLLIVTQDNYSITSITSTVLGSVIDARQMYLNSANGNLYLDPSFSTLFPGFATYSNKLYNGGLLYTGIYSTKLYVNGVENPTGTCYMLGTTLYNGSIENLAGTYVFNGTTLYNGQTVVDSSNYKFYDFNSSTFTGDLPIVNLSNLPSTSLANWSTDASSGYVTYTNFDNSPSTNYYGSSGSSNKFIKYLAYHDNGTNYLVSPVFNSGSNSYVTFNFDFLHFNIDGFNDYMQFGCISKVASDNISSSTNISSLTRYLNGYTNAAMKNYTINFQVSPGIDYYIFIKLVRAAGYNMALDNLLILTQNNYYTTSASSTVLGSLIDSRVYKLTNSMLYKNANLNTDYVLYNNSIYNGSSVVSSSYINYNFNGKINNTLLDLVDLTSLSSSTHTSWVSDKNMYYSNSITNPTYNTSDTNEFINVNTTGTSYLISPPFNTESSDFITFSFNILYYMSNNSLVIGAISKNTSNNILLSTTSPMYTMGASSITALMQNKYVHFNVSKNTDYLIFIKFTITSQLALDDFIITRQSSQPTTFISPFNSIIDIREISTNKNPLATGYSYATDGTTLLYQGTAFNGKYGSVYYESGIPKYSYSTVFSKDKWYFKKFTY